MAAQTSRSDSLAGLFRPFVLLGGGAFLIGFVGVLMLAEPGGSKVSAGAELAIAMRAAGPVFDHS